jgi:hypothetical protein
VRGQAGALPEWFQTLASALDETFTAADLAAVTPTTLAPSPALTATVAATDTVALATATAPPADAASYSIEAFLSELAGAGAQVQAAPGRITKPYLSVPGIIVHIDGQPVQLFEYGDAAALAADVATLTPNAGSIAGMPLTWAAAPHFWRQDGLLALGGQRRSGAGGAAQPRAGAAVCRR